MQGIFPRKEINSTAECYLDELSGELLYRMENVERLDIFNSFVESAFLKPELKHFRISRCYLNELQIDTAEPYQLTELILPGNELIDIPEYLNHLWNITLIDLSNNKLPYLDMHDFTNLNQLTILGLSHNRIRVVFATGFVHMASLKILELSDNLITKLDISRWILPNLNQLFLSNNSLDRIENILDQLPELRAIQMEENQCDCTWRDAVLEIVDSTNRTIEWTGLEPCYEKTKAQGIAHGIAEQSRNLQKLKDSLEDSLTNITRNVFSVMNLKDIADDVFCKIVGGE